MNWIDKMERKYGKYAIKGLMTYIIGITGLVYLISIISPGEFFISKLILDPSSVFKGEVWRLITFIFVPPMSDPIWIFFALYFYYIIGISLESAWGSFRFNLYYFIGIIGTIIAVLLTGGIGTATYLNLSLFLAFAYLNPDYEILLFFIIPVKVRYLGYVNWFFIIYSIITHPLLSYKMAAIASVLNFLVFFGKDIMAYSKTRQKSQRNRRQFQSRANEATGIRMHRCRICGLTSLEDPDMEFRYCSKCDGMQCYCSEHIKNHEHVKHDDGPKVIDFPDQSKDNQER